MKPEDLSVRHAIDALEDAVRALQARIGAPIYLAARRRPGFRYGGPSSQIFLYLRAVRVVSGLNAMFTLVRAGFVQEIGVLARTVDDFLGEMRFIGEAHETGSPTSDQRRLIDQFFGEDPLAPGESGPARGYVPKQKVRASEARAVQAPDTYGMQKSLEGVDEVLSGYVHGHYPQTMELYESCPSEQRDGFCLRGIADPSVLRPWLRQVALQTVAALNEVTVLARRLEDRPTAESLQSARRQLEKSRLLAPEAAS